nr:AMP-binding protein [uncultured Pedobacter sp.]
MNKKLSFLDTNGIGAKFDYEKIKVHRLFERTALKNPNKLALISKFDAITYGDLNRDACILAEKILKLGIKKGDIIAIKLNRGFSMIKSILACLKLGCPYLAIDPTFPQERVAYMVKDCSPQIMLLDKEEISDWNSEFIIGLCVDEIDFEKDSLINYSFDAAENDSTELDLPMYIIYTSGTTGQPKGIVQTYRAITNLIQWQNVFTEIDFSKSVLQFSSFSFDVYLQELFSTFSCGGTLYLISQEERLDPELLKNALVQYQITVIFISVSVMAVLFADPSYLPPFLTDIITAGEQLLISPEMKAHLNNNLNLRVHNHYGVSESHVVTYKIISGNEEIPTLVPVGIPIANTVISILTPYGLPVKKQEIGEIYISGDCLALGYINLPEQTSKTFMLKDQTCWYKTGDFGYWNENNEIVFQGRKDDQVKISGHLVVLNEIEARLLEKTGVKEAVVVATEIGGERRIAAHLVATQKIGVEELRTYLSEKLPDFMIPSYFLFYENFPKGATGKIERKALRKPDLDRSILLSAYVEPANNHDQILIDALSGVLGLSDIGMEDSFLSIGLTSLGAIKASAIISKALNRKISATAFFQYSSPRLLMDSLVDKVDKEKNSENSDGLDTQEIAIIGMAGSFPGAKDINSLWDKILKNEEMLVEYSSTFDDSALIPSGGSRIAKVGIVENAERFDAGLFGISNSDALWMDPQQRKFLEISWACLEDAGIDPSLTNEKIGTFAGAAESSYLFNIQPFINNSVDYLAAIAGGDKDFVASRVSFHLGLKGLAANVQSACSTGLLAVHQACTALRTKTCDLALAGATSILSPQENGFPYSPDAIFSKDGNTRCFEKNRDGTNLTNAVAAVLLKPLNKALEDGDHIYAVIAGIAANNDGNRKNGFTAPSIRGQKEVIISALNDAKISADQISFIETHGTGTILGDQIEVEALKSAYDTYTEKLGFCGLTSIKSRIGHTNRAAGIVGLIIAAKALQEGIVPPLKNFLKEDPEFELPKSPFYIIKDQIRIDVNNGKSTYGAVSSFGFGGTNVHAILKSVNVKAKSKQIDLPHPSLFLLSANDKESLIKVAKNLSSFLKENSVDLLDLAKTLGQGRRPLKLRSYFTSKNQSEILNNLQKIAVDNDLEEQHVLSKVAFIVPGAGVEHLEMGRGLYKSNDFFRSLINEGCEILEELYGYNFLPYFLGEIPVILENKFSIIHSILLLIEVGVGKVLLNSGIKPALMLGLSGGEFACACLSGVMNLKDGLKIVHERGRLMDDVAVPGFVISLGLDAESAKIYCNQSVVISGINSRRHTLLSGLEDEKNNLIYALEKDDIDYKLLKNKNPNHTSHMENVLPYFREVLNGITLNKPLLPFVSSATGSLILEEEATSVDYWCKHLCVPILFAEGLNYLINENCNLIYEIGPRDTMCQLGRAEFPGRATLKFIPAIATDNEDENLLHAIGEFWKSGGNVFRNNIFFEHIGQRISLPSYPFGGERFWLQSNLKSLEEAKKLNYNGGIPKSQWLQNRILKSILPLMPTEITDECFIDKKWGVIGKSLPAKNLLTFLQNKGAIAELIDDGQVLNFEPDILIIFSENDEINDRFLKTSNYIYQTRFNTKDNGSEKHKIRLISFFKDGIGSSVDSAFATLAEVVSLENEQYDCTHIAFDLVNPCENWINVVIDDVASNLKEVFNSTSVYTGRKRLIEVFEPANLEIDADKKEQHTSFESYLIIGGTGAVGYELCKSLISRKNVKIGLIGRTILSDNSSNAVRLNNLISYLESHGTEVAYQVADVTNENQLTEAIRFINKRFKRIDRVLHLAAKIEKDGFLVFSNDLSAQKIDSQLLPKLKGLEVINTSLSKIFTKDEFPYCIAFSSVSVLLGGLGYSSYTYSNRRLTDICLQDHNWKIIHWDVWKSNERDHNEEEVTLGSTLRHNKIDGEYALKIIDFVIDKELKELAVVTVDPQTRIQKATYRNNGNLNFEDKIVPSNGIPNDKLTDILLKVWSNRLFVENLPITANFINFGGDSLTAIRVALDLREA